jgi:hypothetical protein
VVLAPFNTREGVDQEKMIRDAQLLMEEKDFVLRFGAQVREIDRKYEKLNNQDFDNGVYHKYAYKQHSKPANSNDLETLPATVLASNKDTPANMSRIASMKSVSQSLVNLDLPSFYRKINQEMVEKVVEFGYPRDMVIKSLKQNISNHCTTTYYLLCMDQNFN